MADATPPPEGDRLIERLAALGPVLDRLADEADGTRGAPGPAAGGSRGLRQRPRNRRASKPRRRVLAAAAIVIVLAAGLAIVATRDGQETITTNQAATTTELKPDARLTALVRDRVDSLEQCGPAPTEAEWPRPWPEGWKIVSAPSCDIGWVNADAEAVQAIPVYDDAKVGNPIAYWSRSTGWITLAEYQDPDFDVGRYRAAYQAELESRSDTGGN